MVPTRFIPVLALPLLPLLVEAEPFTQSGGARGHEAPATGRIAGTVEVSSALVSRRPTFRIYASAGTGAVPPAAQGDHLARELRNVVIYLAADSDLAAAGPDVRDAAMAQRNERFEPHVLPVVQGTRVAFPNHDNVYHNVFSLSSARAFDLGRFPKGESKDVLFRKPGLVQVFCHIHSDMSAIVLVLPNPHFGVPRRDGAYAIEAVPPGEYTIVGWHERTKPVTRRIRVVAGETATMDFSLPLDGQP